MADDLAALGRKMDDLATAFTTGADGRRLTRDLGTHAERHVLDALDGDLPGRTYSNWGVTLGVTVTETQNEVTLRPTPGGPWKVLDEGRKAGSKTDRNGRHTGWGPTQGKGTWRKSIGPIQREAPAQADEAVRDVLGRLFDGGS